MTLTLDTAWAAGFLFATARMAGFVVASPIFGKALPKMGRFALVLGLAMGLATPAVGQLTVPALVGVTFTNLMVGLILAFASGLLFHLFEIAGGVLDFSSGLSASAVLDPITGHHSSLFQRLFHLTALAIFLVIGGDRLLIRALAASTEAVPLTGGFSFDGGIVQFLVTSLGRLMVAGLEFAAPALVALFLAEVALGVMARFAPQANVFIIGLPMKLLITLAMLGGLLALFPSVVDGAAHSMARSFTDLLSVLSGSSG